MTLARSNQRKTDRLEIRLQSEQRAMLDEAAAASSMSLTAFVLTHATEAAREVLADRASFQLPAERWDEFVELLDRGAKPMPGIVALLAGPSILEE